MRLLVKTTLFMFLYLGATFTVIPFAAKLTGRVRLPLNRAHNLQPLNRLTCLLNRNYVRPELRELTYRVADGMHVKNPDFTLLYLDGNFPFFNRFPLIPHLSHNDGKKLDLAFCYWNKEHQTGSPSFIGYGVSEDPGAGEENKAAFCKSCGYWQYGLLNKVISQKHKSEYVFDAGCTAQIVALFAQNEQIGKIFIEPHLKTRLGLSSYTKIRFQGCHSVRHDDHIHVQLK